MSRITSSTAALTAFGPEAAEQHPSSGRFPGPFARSARDAYGVGLVVIPTASDDAKRPLVRWGRLKSQPHLSTLERWAGAFPGANLAYLPGPSSLAVVDVDDMAEEDRVRALLGIEETPVVIASGRRGLHFPLRTERPIRSLDLRRFGLVADIKSARSIVVAPGSIHPDTGRPYCFLQGDWEAFARAPLFDVRALEALIGQRIDQAQEAPRSPVARSNPQGRRNDSTFAHLRNLGAAGLFRSESEVIEAARLYNADHNDPPEPDGKVVATAGQVWTYIQHGACRAPSNSGYVTLTGSDHAALRSLGRGYADALALFLELKRAHRARAQRGETFAIAATAMARDRVIPGWTDRKRYLRATHALIECRLITLVEGPVLQAWWGSDGKLRRRGLAAAQYRFAAGM